MDPRVFDDLTRRLVSPGTRRATLKAALGGALAVAVGTLRPGGEAAATTAGGSDATCRCAFAGRRFCQSDLCERDEDCCSRKCVNFNGLNEPQELGGQECRGKRCLCRFKGARCGKDCACCSGRCGRDGTCE